MITREQLTGAVSVVASTSVFLVGLVMVVAGAVTGTDAKLADSGSVVVFGSLPVVTLVIARRQQRITREKAQALIREGYRLGVEHASRGLFNPPPGVADDDSSDTSGPVATVHRLYAVPEDPADLPNPDPGEDGPDEVGRRRAQ